MRFEKPAWPSPRHHMALADSDRPVLYFSPQVLQATARRFLAGFPGLVTYAVKANDSDAVLENLMAAGLGAFDVASPDEMARVRRLMPSAVLHYNNPVRSKGEIAAALRYGIASWSVDDLGELEKLAAAGVSRGTEIAVRLRLPVKGAAYDFGAKFGADPSAAAVLLRRVAELGFTPAMTFHPGTQCEDPAAWAAYIDASAKAAAEAGVTLARLNVGGGFPSHRRGAAPDLERIFAAIRDAADASFDTAVPALLCEPGRAMVAESFTLATAIKSIREGRAVYLSDGIYGGLAEAPILGNIDRIEVVSPEGRPRAGAGRSVIVFGPTCDSLDRLPGEVPLPADIEEGDRVLFHGMGAYSSATVTRFNGYGAIDTVVVDRLR